MPALSQLPEPDGPGFDPAVQAAIDDTTELVRLNLHDNRVDYRAASVEAVRRVYVEGKLPRRPGCTTRTWTARIATNLGRDQRRRGWRFEPTDPVVLASFNVTEDGPERDWQRKRLKLALARLRPKLTRLEWVCAFAVYGQGRKATEVARKLRLKPRQVRTEAKRALLLLRPLLVKEGIDGYTDAA
jgi:DNA-directed RNA polymerase specialized sigma24 family protein